MIMDSSFSQDIFICPESAILYPVNKHCSSDYDKWSIWRQKKRLLFQEAKDPEWAGLFFFLFFSLYLFFSLAIGMNPLSVFDIQMLFPILYIFFTVLIVSSAQKFTFDVIQFIFFPLLTAMLLVPYLTNHCLVQGYEDIHPSFLLRLLQF